MVETARREAIAAVGMASGGGCIGYASLNKEKARTELTRACHALGLDWSNDGDGVRVGRGIVIPVWGACGSTA